MSGSILILDIGGADMNKVIRLFKSCVFIFLLQVYLLLVFYFSYFLHTFSDHRNVECGQTFIFCAYYGIFRSNE